MIPSEELEQWEEITSKTPGLWRSVESGGNGEGLFVETLGEVSIDVIDTADYDELNTYCQAIVTAHNALPRLLQEVMELQAKVTRLTSRGIEDMHETILDQQARIAELEAENEHGGARP